MGEFWGFLKILIGFTCVSFTLMVITFLVVSALPASKFRGLFFGVFSKFMWAVVVLMIIYIVSPVDLIPDVIPVVGQVDDSAAAIKAVLAGIAAIISAALKSDNQKDLQALNQLEE